MTVASLLQIVLQPADIADLEWQEKALCAEVDPEIFYPEKGGSTREAKMVCRSCEVRVECLQYALNRDERFGVFGGMSERERRRLKRPQPVGRSRREIPVSRHRGVSWMAPLGKWRARVYIGGERVSLGIFADEEEAARAVTEAEAAYQETQPRKAVA